MIAIHSTILPSTAVEIAEAARPLGVAVLDACVTGGAERAKQKQITYIVGGDADALEKARPVLECNSVKIIHAGPLGNGAKLKLCINLITYIQWAAAFESFTLAKAVGLPHGRARGGRAGQRAAHAADDQLSRRLQAAGGRRKSDAVQSLMRNHMTIAEKDLAWVLALAREAELVAAGRRPRLAADGAALRRRGSEPAVAIRVPWAPGGRS